MSNKQPWPTQAVMEQIYEQCLWGGKEFDFYSGWGSHNPEIINPYLETITSFLKSFEMPLIVLDLGCGDFNIGRHLVQHSKTYIAVDIVKSLIDRNKEIFKEENLEFHCLDISKDKLPPADCVILRQVLQHLSNPEIRRIIRKLKNYKYIILTEHLPLEDFIPNKDIISGQGNRVKYGSGVNLLESPFNLKVKKFSLLDSYILKNNKGIISTTLYTIH